METAGVHYGRFADGNEVEVVLVAWRSLKVNEHTSKLLESSYASAEYRQL